MQKISIQLHADDIIYKPEDIAELEEYPPDQREAMVAAIMKEIGDLCKIGVEDQARCRWHLSKTQGAPSTYFPAHHDEVASHSESQP